MNSTNDTLTKEALREVAAAGEKGIDHVDLTSQFPGDTNVSDLYCSLCQLRDRGQIIFNVTKRRVAYGGGTFTVTRYVATESGRVELARLEEEGK